MKTINEFLTYMHEGRKSIIKVYKFNEKLNKKIMINIHPNEIPNENKLGDIYYVVNNGGDKNEEINMFNAVFIDLDCGRQPNKEYYDLDTVQEYKYKKLNEINQFELKPSVIIETRNGLHVYWKLENNCTFDEWQLVIEKLIIKFDGDKQVKNPARLMRLPFTNWMKDINNPFEIKIIHTNNIKYNIFTFIELLSNINIEDKLNKQSQSSVLSPRFDSEGFGVGDRLSYNKYFSISDTYPNINVNAIKNGDIELLQALLKPEQKIFQTQSELYEYITQEINLSMFLNVSNKSCNCVFHDDSNPSAGIFITNRNQQFYKCHSTSCGFMGNIIRCVERLRKCNRPQAINFIKKVYKLEYIETEWQKEQKVILEENKRMIREGEFEETYPEIYKIIKNYIGLIYELHDLAIDNIYDEKYSDEDGSVIFFSSLKAICEKINAKSDRRIADRIGLLAFLLLLTKLNDNSVPEKYLNKAKHIAAKHKLKSHVNFYSIPSYCDENLAKSLERAIMFVKNNVSMKGWSRELLLRTFGEDIANEIYPQFTHRKTTQKSDIRTNEIHELTIEMINQHGFAMEKYVIEIMRQKYSKTQSEIQIKKSLQEMLDSYGLQRVRLNKKLKSELGIDPLIVEGFPFVIVRK